MDPIINLDPCFFCGKPSVGVYSLAYAPISMQMCKECSERSLVSTHNLINVFTRYSGDLQESIKAYRDPKAQACWRGEYISIPEFYNRLDIDFLDEFYKESPQNYTYLNAKELLKNKPKAKPVEKSCMRNLKETLGQRMLLESFPIAFIGKNDDCCKSSEEATDILYEITRLLHKLHGAKNLEEFHQFVDKDELADVTMWLSEKLYELLRLKKSKEE